MDPLLSSFYISGSGMRVQGERMRLVAQNLANVDSIATTPGGEPYRRKIQTVQNYKDRIIDADMVKTKRIVEDRAPFRMKYMPGHPMADENGNVKYPNVTALTELTDMRESALAYEASLNLFNMTRTVVNRTIDLLR